jgi:hypothetical protein
MSKISKEGYDQIQVIRNALDSMYDKLNRDYYSKAKGKIKDTDKAYSKTNVPEIVKDEFETIASIVEESGTWEEV